MYGSCKPRPTPGDHILDDKLKDTDLAAFSNMTSKES